MGILACELRRLQVAWRDCGGVTEYSVIDNGVGFDMEESAGLFEAFERLSRGGESRGLGLGPSIVARVVQRHEGTIRAEGRPGAGAAFHFTLEPEKTPASDT